jgi:hypothetical protein
MEVVVAMDFVVVGHDAIHAEISVMSDADSPESMCVVVRMGIPGFWLY